MKETGDYAYPLQQYIDDGEDVTLFEMKRDIGGEMWCPKLFDFVDNACGHACKDYNPCNGKSGRCRNLKNGFIKTGKKFRLKDGFLIPFKR